MDSRYQQVLNQKHFPSSYQLVLAFYTIILVRARHWRCIGPIDMLSLMCIRKPRATDQSAAHRVIKRQPQQHCRYRSLDSGITVMRLPPKTDDSRGTVPNTSQPALSNLVNLANVTRGRRGTGWRTKWAIWLLSAKRSTKSNISGQRPTNQRCSAIRSKNPTSRQTAPDKR